MSQTFLILGGRLTGLPDLEVNVNRGSSPGSGSVTSVFSPHPYSLMFHTPARILRASGPAMAAQLAWLE